jgi:hypothetical protein
LFLLLLVAGQDAVFSQAKEMALEKHFHCSDECNRIFAPDKDADLYDDDRQYATLR